jgi:DNA invertase Pin-like site-specific DNA recombinase/peptidoglycan hydrolase-like protein with peptidoglycan-binding domain
MTTHLFSRGNRATTITTVAALAAMALLFTTATPARAADGRTTPVLAQGAGMGANPSAQVRVVQRALQRRGYDLGPPGVDGRFGPLTAAAVRQMQSDYGLAADGIVGQRTRKELRLTRHRAPSTHGSSRRADQRSKDVDVPAVASTQPPEGLASPGASARDASVASTERGTSGFDLFLAVALGGLITLLAATTVVAWRRRKPTTDHRSDGEAALCHAMDHVNGNGAGPERATGTALEQRRTCLPPGHRVIGYVTLSAQPGGGDDDAASAAITASCERAGWDLLEIVRDRDVGPTLERPALGYALERIAEGQAQGLLVRDLQRLSRSIVDLGVLMAWFRNAQAALVALDLDIDTSTPKGHRVASTLITLSDHAYERIVTGGRDGVAGLGGNGRTGRPAVRDHPELLERIASMRAASMSLRAIADQLNEKGVPTLRGGRKWRPSSIQAALGYRRPGPRDRLPSLEDREVRA